MGELKGMGNSTGPGRNYIHRGQRGKKERQIYNDRGH